MYKMIIDLSLHFGIAISGIIFIGLLNSLVRVLSNTKIDKEA